jgi:hypothetical protein
VKNLSVLSLSLAVALTTAGSLVAEEAASDGLKSGPQCGDSIGAFYVTKVAGAEDDGIEEGKNLCYRCRNGARPQVIVFTRSTDANVKKLVKRLDKAVAENESEQLRVFVNVLGDDKEALSDTCKKLAAETKAKNVPFVVPNEFENGPDNYGINAKADVTVLLASDSAVKATHAFSSSKDMKVASIVKDLQKILE